MATTDEHATEDALAGSTALIILEVNNGEITAEKGIEEIEELLGGHGDHEEEAHDDHEEEEGHDDHEEEGLSSEIEHVIEEVEAGEINALDGFSEIN